MKTQERLTRKEQAKAHQAMAAMLTKFPNVAGLRVIEYPTHCDYLVIVKGELLEGVRATAEAVGDFLTQYPGFPIDFMTALEGEEITINACGKAIPLPKVKDGK